MWRSSFAVTRVSSTAMTSAPASVAAARGLRSERLPIGVATIYRPGERLGFMQGIVMAEQPSRRQARRPKAVVLAALAALGLAGCALVPAPAVEPPPASVSPPPPEPARAAPAPRPPQ